MVDPKESSKRPLAVASVVVLLVKAYRRFVSPFTPESCRYTPSCSEYALRALTRHGLVRGLWLTAVRIVRCNPWTEGGEDAVPR